MANNYEGYLLKVNGVVVPLKYMNIKSWSSAPDQETDIDSYQDGDGVLQRGVLPHTRTKIDFDTTPLRLNDKIALQQIIPTNKETRVKVSIEYWNDNLNNYSSAEVYLPPVVFEILDASDTDIIYMPIHYTFIEY